MKTVLEQSSAVKSRPAAYASKNRRQGPLAPVFNSTESQTSAQLPNRPTEQTTYNQQSPLQREAKISNEAFELNKERHDKDRNAIKYAVKKGVETEAVDPLSLRLRNACEWVLSGKSHLLALTKTADSKFRTKSEKESAFFPRLDAVDENVLTGTPKYYKNDVEDNFNIFIGDSGMQGGNAGNMIYVLNASENIGELDITLRHEVQHSADHHEFETKTILNTFKTEYRAHYYQGTFEKFSDTETQDALGFKWTKRQYAVVKHIMQNYPDIKQAWTEDKDGFKNKVNQYVNPDTEAVNKYNSVRIDNLFLTIYRIDPIKLDYNYQLRKLIKDLETDTFGLDQFDRKYLRSKEAAGFKAQFDKSINPEDRESIMDLISGNGKTVKKEIPKLEISKPNESEKLKTREKNLKINSPESVPSKSLTSNKSILSKPESSLEKGKEPLKSNKKMDIKLSLDKTISSTTTDKSPKKTLKKNPSKLKGSIPKKEEPKYQSATLKEKATLRNDQKEEILTLAKGDTVSIPLPRQTWAFSLGGILRLGGLLSSEKDHTWVTTLYGNSGWVRTDAL
jgi:hypothetical protein